METSQIVAQGMFSPHSKVVLAFYIINSFFLIILAYREKQLHRNLFYYFLDTLNCKTFHHI